MHRFAIFSVVGFISLSLGTGCSDDAQTLPDAGSGTDRGSDLGTTDLADATTPVDQSMADVGAANASADSGTDMGVPDMALPVEPGDYYISADGANDAPGTEDAPFATVGAALAVVEPGDLVYIREGVYTTPVELTVSGTEDAPIRWEGYPGETATFRGPGRGGEPWAEQIRVGADWNIIRHITVEDSSGPGIRVFGDYAWIDDVTIRQTGTTGINFWTNTGGKVTNSYIFAAYNQFGNDGAPADGGGADGISFAHCEDGLISRSIAFGNSDDGYDLWGSNNTRIEYSFALENGVDRWNGEGFNGDGNGFKMGNCDSRGNSGFRNLSWGHPRRGFDSNCAQETSIDHGTSFGDSTGFHNRDANNPWNNNLAYAIVNNVTGEMADSPRSNSWDLALELDDADFVGVEPPPLTGMETAAEALALIEASGFMRPAAGSAVIDAGEDQGEPFAGAAPDIGAYEAP